MNTTHWTCTRCVWYGWFAIMEFSDHVVFCQKASLNKTAFSINWCRPICNSVHLFIFDIGGKVTLLLECKCKHFLCFHEFRLWHENAGFVSACNLSVKSFWGQDLVNIRSELYLVLCDLLCDLGCLSSHGLSWAQPSLSGAQPFSQWLQRFVELKSQNLQFLQLPLPRRQKEGVVVF